MSYVKTLSKLILLLITIGLNNSAYAEIDVTVSPGVTSVSLSWMPDSVYNRTEVKLDTDEVVCDTTSDLCTASGLKMGTLYHHFSAQS